jgi:hypothetical protein
MKVPVFMQDAFVPLLMNRQWAGLFHIRLRSDSQAQSTHVSTPVLRISHGCLHVASEGGRLSEFAGRNRDASPLYQYTSPSPTPPKLIPNRFINKQLRG